MSIEESGSMPGPRLANATAKQFKFRLSHHRYAGQQRQRIGSSRLMTWTSAVRPRGEDNNAGLLLGNFTSAPVNSHI